MQSLPPPHVFIENSAECEDAQSASEQVGKITSETTAPEAWLIVITIRNNPSNSAELLGKGEIRNGEGVRVAVRELSALTPNTCTPLARSLGLWATIVLEGRTKAPAASAAEGGATAEGGEANNGSDSTAPRKAVPKDDGSTLRWGLATGVVTDHISSVLMGPEAFLSIESKGATVLRPHLFFGAPVYDYRSPGQSGATPGAGLGLDACGRIAVGDGVRFEECGVVQFDFGVTGNSAGTPNMTEALGVTQGVTFELGRGYRLEARARALFNLSFLNAVWNTSETSSSVQVSSYILQGQLGVSWHAR